MAQETISQRSRIRSLLDAIDRPCWFGRTDGHVLTRNSVAGSLGLTPQWVLDLITGQPIDPPAATRSRHLTLDGDPFRLVIGPRLPGVEGFDFEALGLDELQVETAEHLLRGFSDVEIALILGKPLSAVHALIVQVHRQLGVGTRTELASFVHRTRHETDRPAVRERAPTTQIRSTIDGAARRLVTPTIKKI